MFIIVEEITTVTTPVTMPVSIPGTSVPTSIATSAPVTPCVEVSGMQDPLIIPTKDIIVSGSPDAPVDNLR